jgi:hypothetical protein
MRYIGWTLWSAGLAFAILGTINAWKSSDLYVDIVYKVRVDLVERWNERITKEDLRYDLSSAQDDMIDQRQAGYILISSLMGIGTILIVRRKK